MHVAGGGCNAITVLKVEPKAGGSFCFVAATLGFFNAEARSSHVKCAESGGREAGSFRPPVVSNCLRYH